MHKRRRIMGGRVTTFADLLGTQENNRKITRRELEDKNYDKNPSTPSRAPPKKNLLFGVFHLQ